MCVGGGGGKGAGRRGNLGKATTTTRSLPEAPKVDEILNKRNALKWSAEKLLGEPQSV